MTEVDDLLADPALTMPLRQERLAAAWVRHSDRGAEQALTLLKATSDPRAAALAAGYLALLPGLRREKESAVITIAPRRGDWALAVVDLIRFLSPPAANCLLRQTLQATPDRSVSGVLFELATYFPSLVQPFVASIDDVLIEQAMLPGAPDDWAWDFVQRFQESEDPVFLKALVRMRTNAARSALEALRSSAPARMWPALDASIENCGIFHETGDPSYFPNLALGFVVERGTTPHRLGGGFAGHMPHCELCFTPAAHLLTLSSQALGWTLTRDPSFFWFQCQHHSRDDEPLFVQLSETGAERLIVIELAEAKDQGTPFIPGEFSLLLEEHPNPIGVGRDRVPKRGLHDVGGPPNWCRIDQFPRCPICSSGMRYLATIDGGMSPFGRLQIPGALFLFWCDPCRVSATRLQH